MPFRPLTPEERAQAQAEKDAELAAIEQALQARTANRTQAMKAALAEPQPSPDQTPPTPPKEDFFIERQANPYAEPVQPMPTDAEPSPPKPPRPERIKMPSADGILESCLRLVQRVIDEAPPTN